MIEEIPTPSSKHFKSIPDAPGLFEIRVRVGSNIFRIFCFFDGPTQLLLREYDSPEEGEELEIWAALVEKYEDSVTEIDVGDDSAGARGVGLAPGIVGPALRVAARLISSEDSCEVLGGAGELGVGLMAHKVEV